MDPQPLSTALWAEASRAMLYLYLFAGLGLTSALAFLLGHAIIPSLVHHRDAPPALSGLRWIAYPLSAAALVLTIYALARALIGAFGLMQDFYPRTWI